MNEDTNKSGGQDGYENACYVCHRLEGDTGPMIRMPGNIHICHDCMQKTFDSLGNMDFSQMMPAGMPVTSFFPEAATTTSSTETTESAGEEEPEKKEKQPSGGMPFSNIGMISIGDLSNLTSMFGGMGGMMPPPPKVKQKRAKAAASEEVPEEAVIDIEHIPPPHEIKAKLDDYVVGQEKAKKVISVAVFNHYKRVFSYMHEMEGTGGPDDEVEIEKSNILMLGPTGSGKTYMVRTLARLLDVPLAITDATSLTEAGYIGDDIESVVSKLLAAADNDVERAEHGIIFIDEIDKLAKKHNAHQRDVSGESVQQGMLKLLEGSVVEVPVGASSKNALVPMAQVDTSNILFICGGAFPDLGDIIKERLNKASSMGFVADLKDKYDKETNILSKVNAQDLREFGMIPEFIGRLPIIVALEALDEDALIAVLTEPKNAITKQYRKLLHYDEVDLEFEEDALRAIAKKAMEKELGARGLRSIIEEFMMDIMYEIPKDDNIGTVIVTEPYVNGNGGPRVVMRQELKGIPAQAHAGA